MKKRLYLLEWKLRETRAWLGWMVFWIIISFMFLSAMLMTGHLLNKVVLQPVWLCNPLLELVDIEAVCQVAKSRGIMSCG